MKKKLIVLSSFALGFAPLVALAQRATGTNPVSCGAGGFADTIPGLLCRIGDILNSVIPVLIALGVVYFVWGVIHSALEGELHPEIIFEYLLFASLGLSLVLGVLYSL